MIIAELNTQLGSWLGSIRLCYVLDNPSQQNGLLGPISHQTSVPGLPQPIIILYYGHRGLVLRTK